MFAAAVPVPSTGCPCDDFASHHRPMEFHCQHPLMPAKIPVRREEQPVGSISYRADQQLNGRPGDTPAAAVFCICAASSYSLTSTAKAVGCIDTVVEGHRQRSSKIAMAVSVLHVLSIARCRLADRLASPFAASSRHRSSMDTTLSGLVHRPDSSLYYYGFQIQRSRISRFFGPARSRLGTWP
jgi:hypothetical protein